MCESRPADNAPKRNLLTVTLEDYFQVGAFDCLIGREKWYRFETRLVASTRKTLQILESFGVRATFFVLGWNADRWPELVREVADRGHEIASGGYYHRNIRQMSRSEFIEDLARSREALERAAGRRVVGYRMADGWLGPADLWVLEALAQEGYAYDSSVFPLLHRFRREAWRRFAHQHRSPGGCIWEFPPTTEQFLGLGFPIAGGNYYRQVPHTLMKRIVARWQRRHAEPFVMYLHVWELDPDQPEISGAGRLARLRHYRKLDKMRWVLADYCEKYRFGSVAEYLSLDLPRVSATSATAATPLRPAGKPAFPRREAATAVGSVSAPAQVEVLRVARLPVTLVIPCYNEERTIPYLAKTLESVEQRLDAYELCFLFVDDASKDATWEVLQRVFGTRSNCRLVQQPENRGVAAAILTGIEAAPTETVCSIDCDCSYDPHELQHMIPLLADGVDLVTASPYHPCGGVKNVPAWRLSLSKASSFLYRLVLGSDLHTYTSCFRVYRKSAISRLHLTEGGFLGIAELLGQLTLAGSRVVEYPTTLEVRVFGRSKMKTLRTILGHLRLLLGFTVRRIRRIAPTTATSST